MGRGRNCSIGGKATPRPHRVSVIAEGPPTRIPRNNVCDGNWPPYRTEARDRVGNLGTHRGLREIGTQGGGRGERAPQR